MSALLYHLFSLSSFSQIYSWCSSSSSLTLFLEDATRDKFKGSEDRPLLLKGGGVGGHGAWSDASNVGMVPPAGYKKHWSAHPFPKHLLVKKASEVEVEEERRQMLLKKKKGMETETWTD